MARTMPARLGEDKGDHYRVEMLGREQKHDRAFGVQAISAQVHFQPGGPVIRDRPLETRGIPRG